MTVKITAPEFARIRNEMVAKPLDTEDLLKIRAGVERLHGSLLRVGDPNLPWSIENRARCDALVVVGGFRAGKTFGVENAISRLGPLPVPGGALDANVIQISAPSSMSIESLGREILGPMRLTPARALGPSLTMERLHRRIRLFKPTMIYIDEAQRLLTPERVASHRIADEQKKIFSHLRALMDLAGAPVPIVLSGTRELIPVLQRDDLGFFRDRKDIVFLEPMKVGDAQDRGDLEDALKAFADKVGMKVGNLSKDFYDRVILAANFARGLAFEICQEAILNAVAEGRNVVEVEDFVSYYARKAGALRVGNPFAATDWHRIDPTALLAAMSGPNAPKIGDLHK